LGDIFDVYDEVSQKVVAIVSATLHGQEQNAPPNIRQKT